MGAINKEDFHLETDGMGYYQIYPFGHQLLRQMVLNAELKSTNGSPAARGGTIMSNKWKLGKRRRTSACIWG